MTSFDPGRVTLRLKVADGRVEAVTVFCDRPEVARVLRGRPAEKAAAMVPLIYSLCGKAQGIAARAALAAARGQVLEPHVDAGARDEAAREHAWKLFVDWPGQLGFAADEAFFVTLMRSLPEQRGELATALAAHPLPASLRAAIGDGEIEALLAGRLSARLGELGDWLAGRPGSLGMVSATCVAPESGEARVETARGTLVHRLALAGDLVADYSITAPTDVLFAADGEAAHLLAGLPGLPVDEAQRLAERLVMALDPCVPWVCEVG